MTMRIRYRILGAFPHFFSVNPTKVLCRPLEYFRSCSTYFDGRYNIPSRSVAYSVGRWSTPSRSIAYFIGRHDVCANCGSILSAVRVFPQL